jgi:hypothetical protein
MTQTGRTTSERARGSGRICAYGIGHFRFRSGSPARPDLPVRSRAERCARDRRSALWRAYSELANSTWQQAYEKLLPHQCVCLSQDGWDVRALQENQPTG